MTASLSYTTQHVIERMAQSIGAEFQVDTEMMLSRSRIEQAAMARQVLMVMLCRKGMSLHQCARELNRDHGTINHAHKSVQNRRDTDRHFDEVFRRIDAEFREMPSIHQPKAWAISSVGDLAQPYYF
jgi:chromosomal replication initiation ATPase DnaA